METAGVAPIKAQYLTTKEKFHAYLDQEGERRNCQGDGKDARKDICTEPPAKLQKTEEGDGDAEEGRKGEDANKAEGGRKAGEDNKAEDGVMEEDGSKTEEGWKIEDGSKVHGSKKEDDSKADGSKTEDSSKVHGSMEEDGSKVHGSMKEDSNKVHGSMEEDGSKVHGSMEEDGSKVHGSMKKDGSKADGSKTEDGNEVHGSMEEDGSKKEDSNKVHGSMEEDGSKAHGSMKEEGNKAEDGVMEVDDTKTEESQKTEGGNKADGSAKEDGSKAHGSMTEEGNKAEDGVMEVEGNKEEEGNKADGSPREEEGSKREEGNPPEEVSGNARLQQGRKRARGQNKIRPCLKPAEYEKHRLCPSIVQDRGGKCLFGSRCNYIHDVKEYVALKPPDLGEACILFSTFGKCPYGVTCRFAGAHTGKGHENVVNQELAKAWEGKTVVKNTLGKELQHQLRKKKFPFAKATEYLRRLAEVLEAKGAERQPEIAGSPDAKRGYAHNAPIWAMPRGSCVYPGEGPTPVAPQQPPPLIPHLKRVGAVTDEDRIKIRPCEKRKLDLSGKLYLAPLTTCGNLPFRRVCKKFGADITCGEMAVCTNLLQGQTSEWALLKRHHTEDIFGVQLEGSFPDTMTKCAELLNKRVEVDFVDINAGCPIDLVYNKGGGAALMNRMTKFEQIVRGMNYVLDVPLTVKIRTGVQEKTNLAHKLIPSLREWGVSLVTLHGRSREQRYTKAANWSYIEECAKLADPMPLFGNGDILSFEDVSQALQRGVSGVMIARGALIKPWIFTEVKERRHWDISSAERLEILKDFTSYGLEQWGSDTQGVEKTRRFLLEWLSFLCRYIPVGLLERLPQRINERPPYYMGRDYLETLMASQNAGDWIKISEILLGPVLPNFTFLPKHKANSYK